MNYILKKTTKHVMVVLIAIVLMVIINGCNCNSPELNSYSQYFITHRNDGFTTHRTRVDNINYNDEITIISNRYELPRGFYGDYIHVHDFLYDHYNNIFFENNFLVILYVSQNQESLDSNLAITFGEQETIIYLFSEKDKDDSDTLIQYFFYVIELNYKNCKNQSFTLNKIFTNIEE
jgi:outer membrane lipoprotein-sorting protein